MDQSVCTACGKLKSICTCTRNTVNHPSHYNQHPSGVECIDIIQWFPYNVGAVIKHLWRADLKGDRLEDLQKALTYLEKEIEREAIKHNHQIMGLNTVAREAIAKAEGGGAR